MHDDSSVFKFAANQIIFSSHIGLAGEVTGKKLTCANVVLLQESEQI